MKLKALSILLLSLLLSGCSSLVKTTPAALPTVVLGDSAATPQASSQGKSDGVTASGVVVPAQQVHLAFALGEVVTEVRVAVGDQVKAGQMLAKLDDSALQAQIRQAQAAVAAAQASYDLLAAGPTSAQLRQADAAVISARAAYSRTIESARNADVVAAKAALDAAHANYNKVKAGPRKEDYAVAEASLRTAEVALRQAQTAYDRALSRNPAGISGDPAALGLEKATNDYKAAKALYDALSRPPDEAQLTAAYQQVAAAQSQLDRLLQPVQAFDLEQAQAQIDAAQARLDELRAGARPEQLAVAKAQVESAQAALAVLEAQSQKYILVAPLDAIVLSRTIEPGETALPGTPLLVLGDLENLRVETTDLSERDVPEIEMGQPATVFIKALNQSVTGRVSQISPLASTLGGDVVYKITVDLDTQPSGLRAGMSVEVQFGT